MHELSLAVALVEQVEAALLREQSPRAVRIDLAVGALAGVDPEAFAFAFPIAAEGTPVEGAKLNLRPVPLQVKCADCGQESEPSSLFLIYCEKCESTKVEIVSGRGMVIEAIEIE